MILPKRLEKGTDADCSRLAAISKGCASTPYALIPMPYLLCPASYSLD